MTEHNRSKAESVDLDTVERQTMTFIESWTAAGKPLAALAVPVTAIEVMAMINALRKIDEIRNGIVGYQKINWSAHIYPLVAALEEAGIHGEGYEVASAKAKTQVARIAELESIVRRFCDAMELADAWPGLVNAGRRALDSRGKNT
jgi:hypothetical protein